MDLQTVGSMLFEQTIDIALPYIQLSEDKSMLLRQVSLCSQVKRLRVQY